MRTAAIGPRSRVGIILPPGPEGAVLGVAVASHAISVPLNSNRPESEIEEELTRAGLEALVLPSWVDSPALAIAQRSSFGLIEASRGAGSLSSVALRQVRETSVLARKPVHPALDSIALIFTTSGTTGTGRLIPVTHEDLLVTADKMRQWFNLSSDDRTAFVTVSPDISADARSPARSNDRRLFTGDLGSIDSEGYLRSEEGPRS